MNEIDVKKAAKKIQLVQTFQELHDIMVAYVNLDDYKSQNASPVPRRCPSPRAPVDYQDYPTITKLHFDKNYIFGLNKDDGEI